jgi:hypothetical protein
MKKQFLITNHNGARIYTMPSKKYDCKEITEELSVIMNEKGVDLNIAKGVYLDKVDPVRVSMKKEFPLGF